MQATETKNSGPNVQFPVYEYLVLFVPIALLILVVGFTVIFFRAETRINSLIDEDSVRLHHIGGFIGAQMSSASNHLQSIFIEADTHNAVNSITPEAVQSLQLSLLILAQRNPEYEQVRWIDETGVEIIRISRGLDGPYAEPRQNLQNKNQRYYFKAASALPAGELYASEIDLNVEHGKIELPPKPMLRIAIPLMDSKENRRGIIIINILMTPVFEKAQYFEQASKTGNNILLNQQGDLLHGRLQMPGLQQANDSVTNISTVYPAVWDKISRSDVGHFEHRDELWTWKSISSFDNLAGFNNNQTGGVSGAEKPIAGEFSLIYVVQRPLDFVMEMRRDIRFSTFAGVFVALLVYGISLYFYLGGLFRARRAELEATYAMAHATHMTRLKEMEERFRRLVESSSVGQMVVDSEGKIEICNATVEQMLGYQKKELIGSKVEKLLPVDRQQAHLAFREGFMQEPESRKMGEGRKLEALRKDGTTIPVEIGLNPYTDQDRKLVLVNVIELSNQTKS